MLKIEQGPHANVHNVYFEKVKGKWKQRIFFCSDIHWDSKKCRRDMLKKHFDHCKANDIPIFIFGDMLDFDLRLSLRPCIKSNISPKIKIGMSLALQ